MFDTLVEKLCCCCNGSDRKPEPRSDVKGEVLRMAEIGVENGACANVGGCCDGDNKSDSQVTLLGDDNNVQQIANTIRRVALCLLKQATYNIVKDRTAGARSLANREFLGALEAEYLQIEYYPEYVVLADIIMKGPTPKNKQLAESVARELSRAIIKRAEIAAPLLLTDSSEHSEEGKPKSEENAKVEESPKAAESPLIEENQQIEEQ